MTSILSTRGDAAEVIGGSGEASVVLCCEHASERLPGAYRWPEADQRLVGSHWALDLGAGALTRELSDALGAPAVLARFSRLLCDPNRPEDSDTLFRDVAEGEPVALNTGLSDGERERRLQSFYRPYHAALSSTVESSFAPVVFSVHSFTPIFEGGEMRPMEVGVVFDREDELAFRLQDHLERAEIYTSLNEPYSGKDGFMYSAVRHASWHGRGALEIEVRQDRCTDPAFRKKLVAALAEFFS